VNILIVEDEHALRLAVVKLLRKEGFSVTGAGDGTVALDLIRAQKPNVDVLLLDISLPGASSRDVLEEAQRLNPGITVIVTTAYTKEKAAALLAADVEHYVHKPYGLRELLNKIREVAP